VTVFGSTRNSPATSPGVSSDSLCDVRILSCPLVCESCDPELLLPYSKWRVNHCRGCLTFFVRPLAWRFNQYRRYRRLLLVPAFPEVSLTLGFTVNVPTNTRSDLRECVIAQHGVCRRLPGGGPVSAAGGCWGIRAGQRVAASS
jgi:hypothetical protein